MGHLYHGYVSHNQRVSYVCFKQGQKPNHMCHGKNDGKSMFDGHLSHNEESLQRVQTSQKTWTDDPKKGAGTESLVVTCCGSSTRRWQCPSEWPVGNSLDIICSNPQNRYNVRPPRQLSWFITPITMVYGTYNSGKHTKSY